MRILSLILVVFVVGCTRAPKTNKGLEIYQVNKPYPDFTKEEDGCRYCLDLKTEDLFTRPVITEVDIREFDWEKQRIELTDDARERINDLDIPLEGLPVALVLNGEIIYGFWFWNVISSFGCDRVYTYPTMDFSLQFGLPSDNTYGDDPRFDHRLNKYVGDVKAGSDLH